MDAVETNIKRDINNIVQKAKRSKSKSTYVYNIIDLDCLYDLCDILDIKYNIFDILDYRKLQEFSRSNLNNTYALFLKNKNFIEIIAKNIVDSLQNNTLFPINPSIKLEYNDLVNISKDFLKDYNVNIFNSLVDCIKKNKVFYYDDFEEEGLTYSSVGNNFSPYIIIDSQNTIMSAVSLVHEATHAYYRYYRNLFKNSTELNILNSNISEIPSYTLELYFFEWLKSKKICLEDNYILKNNFFNLLLDIAHYFANLFDNQDFIFTKNDFANFASIEKKYILNIDTFIGKSFACYLYSLNDIEKVNYLIDKLFQNKDVMSLEEIIRKNNLDYEDIINFESGKKLIKKIYTNGGINNEKI